MGRWPVRFDARLRLNGKTATGVPIPDRVIEDMGGGRRPRVTASINGCTFQTSLGTISGQTMLPVSAAIRSEAGLEAGDRVVVEIALTTESPPVTIPADLQAALAADAAARTFFDGLTSSQQRGYTEWIALAKRAETRQRRLVQTVLALRERRSRR